jgi:urease accessory protein UreE
MSGLRAAVIVLVVIALAGAGGSVHAEEASSVRHLPVAVCDNEHLPPEVLVAAEQVAADVYRDIGIAVDWIHNECSPTEGRLAVSVVSRATAGIDVSDYTLGFAESGTLDATVLYDRVHAFARRYRVKCEVLLGYAVAHELGHLLLPPKSHSAEGVMRATIDLEMASARRLRFTAEQGTLIAGRLKAGPAYTAAARPQNCCDASRAPSAIAASLPQTTSGSTAAWPTHVP